MPKKERKIKRREREGKIKFRNVGGKRINPIRNSYTESLSAGSHRSHDSFQKGDTNLKMSASFPPSFSKGKKKKRKEKKGKIK
jgi:hypothetical protein